MDACGCPEDFASIFDRRTAESDRDRHRRKGPDRTTRMLLDLLRPAWGPGATLLDVGGGIGAIDQAFLREGGARAVLVDASEPYVQVAREEAERAGLADRITFVQGDFVQRAADVGPADVVTLDRVICCYRNADDLVRLSADRATRAYGLVLPRDRWLFHVWAGLLNFAYRLRRKSYRAFAHPNRRIDELVAAVGLAPTAEARTFVWRVVVYERVAAA